MTEPCDLTAIEARRLIGRRDLSPVELLESCLTRMDETDPAVNAMVARDDTASRDAAKAAEAAVLRGDALGPLHGLPVGIKDLTPTRGLRTTWGSPLFRDHVPAEDHSLVANIRAAGGIIVGKTNTPEFGAGANTRNAVYGATGNPFDNTKNAAGSSGGSAVSLAVNQVPLCSGSDMGGSLRNPAAFCGIVGFRPTPGLVPDEGKGLGWSGLGVQGPMARNVADLCLLQSVMATDQGCDPLATTIFGKHVREPGDFHPVQAIDLGGLRVAITPDFGFAPTEAHIREVFLEKVALFRHHFRSVSEATPDCTGTDDAFEVLRSTNFVAGHIERWHTARDKLGPNIVANMEAALKYTIADVSRAGALQTQLYQRWQAFFREFDVILTPSITISPRPWTELFPKEIDGKPTRTYFHWLAMAYAVTVVGHPAVSLPVGRDRAGMPFGLQIVGPRGGDARVLQVAAALEDTLAGDPRTRRPVPDIAALKAATPISEMPHFMGFN
jgi:Asp-tRNA(Asn)/Glu-tRNA(Gln) amidotransferase A subunit family amidase